MLLETGNLSDYDITKKAPTLKSERIKRMFPELLRQWLDQI